MGESWPRLSEQLEGEKRPDRCQSCGASWDLDRWREHNMADLPEPIVVVMCLECSDAAVEAHPRLYEPLHRNQPWPGCMNICVDCRHREGVSCRHPDLMANGGPGLAIETPRPNHLFWHGEGEEGEAVGGVMVSYPCEPKRCVGRDPAAVAEAEGGRSDG